MSMINISCDSTMIPDPHKKSSTLLTLMAYQDPDAYNLMYGKVFFAMPTCPVMTIFRRADEPRSRRRSRGQDEEGRQYIGASASSGTSQDEDQDHCSGGLILILMIPTLGP